MTRVDTWPHEVDDDFQGKGTAFKPVIATVEQRFRWGYTFVEDDVMTEKGKRIWSGPRGPWNEGTGKFDYFDGPTFEAGTKVRVGLSQRGQYSNLNFISAVSPAESDDGDSGAYNLPGSGSKASPPVVEPTTTEINIRLGMAFNNLTAMMATQDEETTSPGQTALGMLAVKWNRDPMEVWVEWMAAAAEGQALPMVVPVETDAPVVDEDDAYAAGGDPHSGAL